MSSISQDQFAQIVSGVLDLEACVQAYTVTNMGVTISVAAPMRKENVNAFLDFDDHGAITGRYSYAQTDADARLPREIGTRISQEIRNRIQR